MLIIPAIDLMDGQCVRLKQGDPSRKTVYHVDPVATALRWQDEGATCLHLVNLDGAFGNGVKNIRAIERICRALTIPVQLGGGIRSAADAEKWLQVGVFRIIVGTLIIVESQTVCDMLGKFGKERIIAGLDARNGKIAIKGWQQSSEKSLWTVAEELEKMGIIRTVFTDVQKDGLQGGPNYLAIKELTEKTALRIIVSGGVAETMHLDKLRDLNAPQVEGVIIGTALYENSLQLAELIAAYQ